MVRSTVFWYHNGAVYGTVAGTRCPFCGRRREMDAGKYWSWMMNFWFSVGIKSFLNWEKTAIPSSERAADGKQALEIMEQELPDVVLTDLKMDGMDGFELIKWAGKRFSLFSS